MFDVQTGAFKVGLEQVAVADLFARFERAVIDALVADHRLQQFGCGRGAGGVGLHGCQSRASLGGE